MLGRVACARLIAARRPSRRLLSTVAATSRRLLSTVAATEGSELVLISNPPGLRVVDLNRPQALNSLNSEMVSTLLPLVQDWQTIGGDVKLVAVRGTGARAFCAGGDIRFLHDCAASRTPDGRKAAHDFFRDEYTLNHAIGTSRVPFVSILEGIVMGGGVGLSVHGRFRIATEHTIFAMPETAIGFFPDVGGTYFLPRLRGELGTFLGLTGARLKGRDVLTAGIATHFVPQERVEALEALVLEFAANTVGKAGTLESNQDFVDERAFSAAVGSLDRLTDHVPSEAEAEDSSPPMLNESSLAQIDETFCGDTVDDIVARVGVLAADATAKGDGAHWALVAARELDRASPTSLRVTLEGLRRGAACTSLAECLEMEYRMAQRFMKHDDFLAGVGAVLSKERGPRPTWASAPTQEQVDEFFVAVEAGELSLAASSTS